MIIIDFKIEYKMRWKHNSFFLTEFQCKQEAQILKELNSAQL